MKTITIGRDNSCDIVIHNDRISRRHATITPLGNGGYLFRDMSNNGTSVNGVIVRNSERLVRFGDPILLAGIIHFPWNRVQQGGSAASMQRHNAPQQPHHAPQAYNTSHFYEPGGVHMDRSQAPGSVGKLPYMNTVMILSIISIVFGFTIIGIFFGIILAVIALILADKAQDAYLTHPVPSAWMDYPSLKRNMILAIVGFVINGFWIAFSIDYGISSAIAEMKLK